MATADDAIAWARRGFRVFPARVLGKRPAIENNIAEATTDEDKIRAWWTDDYNVALAMGGGYVAIDLDTKYDTDDEKVVDAYDMLGGTWDTLVNRTVSGGYHVIFRDERQWRTETSILGKGSHIDVRAEGGYIIAPPSFVIEDDRAGSYEVENDVTPAPLPDAIAALLKFKRERVERVEVGASDNDAAIASYANWLQFTADPAVEGQGGDAQTYDVACMGVRDFGLTVETTFRLMLEHYNPRCLPPWDADELLHKVENADSYAIGNTGSKDPTAALDGLAFKAPTQPPNMPPIAPAARPVRRPKRLIPDDQIPLVEWLVPYILQRGEVTLVSGPSSAGKSSWMLGAAVFAAVGKTYGPFQMPHPFATMVYNAEDNDVYTSGRASATCILHNLDFARVSDKLLILDNSDPIILAEKTNGVITTPQRTIDQLNAVMEEQPDTALFIFDPLVACIRGVEENDNAEMNEVIKAAALIARSYNVAVLIGHHMRKGILDLKMVDKTSLDLSRGAGATISTARISLNLLPQTMSDKEVQGVRRDVFSVSGAKANHGPDSGTTWWQRRIIQIKNGQSYPAPLPIQYRDIASAHWQSWIDTIGDHMVSYNLNEFKVGDAAVLLTNLDTDDTRSSKSISNALRDYIFRRGELTHRYVDKHGTQYTMALHTQDDNGKSITRGQFFTLVPLASTIALPPIVLPPPPSLGDDMADLV